MKTSDVLYFGPYFPPFGGVATTIEAMRRTVNQSGKVAHVLGYGQFENNPKEGIERIAFPSDRREVASFIKKIFPKLGRTRILHDNSEVYKMYSAFFAFAYLLAVKISRVRWVLTIHDPSLHVWHKPMMRWFLKQVDIIVVTNNEIAAFLASIGIPARSVKVIPPLLPFHIELPLEGEVRSELRAFVDAHDPIISTMGAWIPEYYDTETMVRAVQKVLLTKKKLGLIVVAERFAGAVQYSEYEKKIQKMLDAMGDAVLVVSGLSRYELEYVYRSSRVFVRPAGIGESFGLCKVEALMAGATVITTKQGVTEGMQVYPAGDVEALAGLIMRSFQSVPDPEVRHSYIVAAQSNARALVALYRGLLG